MGSTLSTPPVHESANRRVLADLHRQLARQNATIAHLKTSLQQQTNAYNVLCDKYTTLTQKGIHHAKVVQRHKRAVARGDQRIQDFLQQIERLHRENQELTSQLANASQVNCTFETQLRQYKELLQTRHKQCEFANTCIREKDQIIQHLTHS